MLVGCLFLIILLCDASGRSVFSVTVLTRLLVPSFIQILAAHHVIRMFCAGKHFVSTSKTLQLSTHMLAKHTLLFLPETLRDSYLVVHCSACSAATMPPQEIAGT